MFLLDAPIAMLALNFIVAISISAPILLSCCAACKKRDKDDNSPSHNPSGTTSTDLNTKPLSNTRNDQTAIGAPSVTKDSSEVKVEVSDLGDTSTELAKSAKAMSAGSTPMMTLMAPPNPGSKSTPMLTLMQNPNHEPPQITQMTQAIDVERTQEISERRNSRNMAITQSDVPTKSSNGSAKSQGKKSK